ncbi:MAG: alpha/beta fold hydrolase [Bacteroidetes Order II. Incertae sedis bacterium]|nr:alpha/beta fold hydrolase [Bacteroidetes Order II. bacterium]
MQSYRFIVRQKESYEYWDEGPENATALLFLHGMLGDIRNWQDNVLPFTEAGYRVIAPILPCYHLPLRQTHIKGLVEWVHGFLNTIGLPKKLILVGNSLGGQVAMFYSRSYPLEVSGMVLSGSAGIRELAMKSEFFRRNDDDFLRMHAGFTFHNAEKHVTPELMEEMKGIISNREQALRLIAMGRSSKSDTVCPFLAHLRMPTLLLWGEQDRLTQPDVAEELHAHLPHSTLRFIPQCGHAPMMEQPTLFNEALLGWLNEQFPVFENERLHENVAL